MWNCCSDALFNEELEKLLDHIDYALVKSIKHKIHSFTFNRYVINDRWNKSISLEFIIKS